MCHAPRGACVWQRRGYDYTWRAHSLVGAYEITNIYRYLRHLSIRKWEVYQFLLCSTWGVSILSRPHTIF
jgi:hypothetical protein